MKKQKGFTLIELIIVIVILGILAAYAVPKYMSVDKEARRAVVEGLRGSMYAAADITAAMVSAKGRLSETAPNNKCADKKNAVDTGRGVVCVGETNYPLPTKEGIGSAVADESGFDCGPTSEPLEDGVSGPIDAQYACKKTNAPDPDKCVAIYQYDGKDPKGFPRVYDIDTGC